MKHLTELKQRIEYKHKYLNDCYPKSDLCGIDTYLTKKELKQILELIEVVESIKELLLYKDFTRDKEGMLNQIEQFYTSNE